MGRFFSFVAGGVVGAVAALLLAPAKGSDTRKQVVETVQEKVPQSRQIQKCASSLLDSAAKTSTTAINTVIDKGTEVKRGVAAKVAGGAGQAANPAEANEELRAKIDAARERIASQVAKNAEAIQDAAVDKIPVVVDAVAAAGEKVTTAANTATEKASAAAAAAGEKVSSAAAAVKNAATKEAAPASKDDKKDEKAEKADK